MTALLLRFLDLFTPPHMRPAPDHTERLDFLQWESELQRPYDWAIDDSPWTEMP